jgi:hypothetical protein
VCNEQGGCGIRIPLIHLTPVCLNKNLRHLTV